MKSFRSHSSSLNFPFFCSTRPYLEIFFLCFRQTNQNMVKNECWSRRWQKKIRRECCVLRFLIRSSGWCCTLAELIILRFCSLDGWGRCGGDSSSKSAMFRWLEIDDFEFSFFHFTFRLKYAANISSHISKSDKFSSSINQKLVEFPLVCLPS